MDDFIHSAMSALETSVERTPKQERFCILYCEISNASEAYRLVYDVDPNCKPETVWCNACQLLANTKVAHRIMELQEQARELHLVTVESLTNEFEEARLDAKETKQPAAQVSATLGKAKVNGIGVDKKQILVETSDRMVEILRSV